MIKLKNKKAIDLPSELVIFLVIVGIFAGILLIAVSRTGTGADIVEKVYARQIALVIDNLRIGTSVTLYLPELFDNANKNKFEGEIFNIDFDKQTVTIKTEEGEGKSFAYFNKIEPGQFSANLNEETITINK